MLSMSCDMCDLTKHPVIEPGLHGKYSNAIFWMPVGHCPTCLNQASMYLKWASIDQKRDRQIHFKIVATMKIEKVWFYELDFWLFQQAATWGGVTKFMVFELLENIDVDLLMVFKLACGIDFQCSALKWLIREAFCAFEKTFWQFEFFIILSN